MDSTNDLIRRLQDEPALRAVCGFGDQLPHRTTFNRFISRLSDHSDLVEQCINGITTTLEDLLPGFGTEIAIDSTFVPTFSNPNKSSKVTGLPTDPEAAWGYKTDARSKKKDGVELAYGYKLHAIVDSNYEVPIAFQVMAANHNDSPQLRGLVDRAYDTFSWFQPQVATGDRGYDATSNFQYLYLERGIDPVVHVRRPTAHDERYDGLFDKKGLPHCLGNQPMEFVGQDGEGQFIFRCQSGGCHLREGLHAGIRHCDTIIVEDPAEHLRALGGKTKRATPEWRRLYAKRWAVERCFKSLKSGCRLERHAVRGLRAVNLHVRMSILVHQARALVKLLAGDLDGMRWQVRKVA